MAGLRHTCRHISISRTSHKAIPNPAVRLTRRGIKSGCCGRAWALLMELSQVFLDVQHMQVPIPH